MADPADQSDEGTGDFLSSCSSLIISLNELCNREKESVAAMRANCEEEWEKIKCERAQLGMPDVNKDENAEEAVKRLTVELQSALSRVSSIRMQLSEAKAKVEEQREREQADRRERDGERIGEESTPERKRKNTTIERLGATVGSILKRGKSENENSDVKRAEREADKDESDVQPGKKGEKDKECEMEEGGNKDDAPRKKKKRRVEGTDSPSSKKKKGDSTDSPSTKKKREKKRDGDVEKRKKKKRRQEDEEEEEVEEVALTEEEIAERESIRRRREEELEEERKLERQRAEEEARRREEEEAQRKLEEEKRVQEALGVDSEPWSSEEEDD